jgi:hypothetical protein
LRNIPRHRSPAHPDLRHSRSIVQHGMVIDGMGPQKGGDAPPPYSKTKPVAKPNWRGRLLALFRSQPNEQLNQSVSKAEKEPSMPQPAPKKSKRSPTETPTKTPEETSEPPIAKCNRCKRPFFLKPSGQVSSCGKHHPGRLPFQSGMHTERVYEPFGCSDADYGNSGPSLHLQVAW